MLEVLYQSVVIPDAVADELAAAKNLTISTILEHNWIQIKSLTHFGLANQLHHERGLDVGESHAIALAFELHADSVLIDERLGRQEAIRLGQPIIGILGILLVAKKRNLIPQVQPVIDTLINQAGFRISSQLYAQILGLAEEP